MTGSIGDHSGIRDRLRAALPAAIKARDMATVSALRSALAAIENAEAVDIADGPTARIGESEIAGAVTGLGAGDGTRRVLDEAQIRALVEAEIHDRRQAADAYERSGQAARAERLRAEARALTEQLADG